MYELSVVRFDSLDVDIRIDLDQRPKPSTRHILHPSFQHTSLEPLLHSQIRCLLGFDLCHWLFGEVELKRPGGRARARSVERAFEAR